MSVRLEKKIHYLNAYLFTCFLFHTKLVISSTCWSMGGVAVNHRTSRSWRLRSSSRHTRGRLESIETLVKSFYQSFWWKGRIHQLFQILIPHHLYQILKLNLT